MRMAEYFKYKMGMLSYELSSMKKELAQKQLDDEIDLHHTAHDVRLHKEKQDTLNDEGEVKEDIKDRQIHAMWEQILFMQKQMQAMNQQMSYL